VTVLREIASLGWPHYGHDSKAEQFIANPVLGELYRGVFDVPEVIHYLEDDSSI
jgi:hypothetical protein